MEERNLRKTRVGVVVSDKMDKTIVVAVKDSVQHPMILSILSDTATPTRVFLRLRSSIV